MKHGTIYFHNQYMKYIDYEIVNISRLQCQYCQTQSLIEITSMICFYYMVQRKKEKFLSKACTSLTLLIVSKYFKIN